MNSLNKERYGDMFPALRDWRRGFLWRLRLAYPWAYTGLSVSLLLFCIGIFGVSMYLSYFANAINAKTIFDVDLALFDTASMIFIPIIIGALTFLGYTCAYWEISSYFFRRMVRKFSEDDRMEVAKDLADYAHSISAVDLCDIDDLCEGRKVGLSNDEILAETEDAIRQFQKTALQIGYALVASDKREITRGFERLVGFDKFSVRRRIEAINHTLETLPESIKKKRIEAVVAAARERLNSAAQRAQHST